MKHIVNKLEFELECPTEEQAFELRQKLYPAGQDEFAGIIDNVCSKYVSENEWIKIDKIEINLGELSLSQFEHEFSRSFEKIIESIIAEKIAAIPLEKLSGSKESSELELLEYFLLNGYLPWWADESSVVPDEIISNVFKNKRTEIIEFFIAHINNIKLWERTSYQLNEYVLTIIVESFKTLRNSRIILESIFEIISEEISLIHNDIKQLFTIEVENVRKNFVKILIFNTPLIFKQVNDYENLKSVLAGLVLKEAVLINNKAEFKKIVIEKINKISIEDKYHKNKFSSDTDAIAAIEDKVHKKEFSSDTDVFTDSESAGPNAVNSADITDSVFNADVIKAVSGETEKLMVRHAGIILLAPFLKKFFSNIGLLDENIWISTDAQFRGVHLLKYLSTGETEVFEYRLILEKIICGIALEEPVPKEIVLSEKELFESGQLLESVIEHWKVLKNTSVNGLRETFLKRDGIISKNESGWLLQIERKTVDVLLESIPWGISTTRLPWNDYLIITEW